MNEQEQFIPMILENAGFRVRLFLFRARHDDAHGHSLQGGAPTVGALGDAALDENRWAINLHFQVSWVYTGQYYKHCGRSLSRQYRY